MITRTTQPYNHPHPDGVVTNYEMETIKRDGANPIFIVRNSDDNKGHGFNSSRPLNDHITEKHATKAREDFKLKPNELNWYEQRKDGDYDKVHFRMIARGADDSGKHEQQWGESKRTVYTKEQVDKEVSNYVARDKDVQQKLSEETNMSKQSFSEKNIDRQAEMQKLQEQQKKQEPNF